jgi:Fe-S cluster biogenesis protein NfuA/nitrite reductase/ring-hydroxylating ferredoxin subunit
MATAELPADDRAATEPHGGEPHVRPNRVSAEPSGAGPRDPTRERGDGPAPPVHGGQESSLFDALQRFEQIFASWEDPQRGAVAAYKRAVDALHGEAVRRIVRTLKAEPAAIAALRAAVADEVVYAVLRQLGVVKPSVDERVQAALDGVRPMLASHGGDVELVRVDPPAIEVRFLGACDGCASSAMTFHAGVQQAVFDACPEITEVIQHKGAATGHGDAPISPFAVTPLGIWRDACGFDEIADGGLRAVVIGDRRLLVTRRGRAVTCFDNACAHLGLALDDGELDRGTLTCAHHGFQYDLATGECLTAPSVALASHPARVLASRVEVKLPR